MDYKEKYEMALEGIQEILGSGEDSIKMSRLQLRLQGIFPELKEESENERIVKELLTFFRESIYREHILTNKEYDSWVAWLEKQGEQKPAENKGMNLVEEEMTPFQKKVFCIIDTTIEEEQGLKQVCDELLTLASNEIKQKPTTEIKSAEESLGIDSDTYNKIVDECIYGEQKPAETEKGAKGNFPLIPFSEQKPADKGESFDEYEGLTDFERTLADICIGWIGQELGWKQYIKDNADVLLKIAIKKFNSIQDAPFEQKPAEWSEEDNLQLQAAIDICKSSGHTITSDWLKSIKDKIQPKQEWSEEDSRILYNVKAYIGYAAGQSGVKDELFKEANEWLNSLPIGFIYSKNYNEDMVTLLVSELKQIANDNNVPEQYQMEINWLKSLRPQKQWKPSDEQMEALRKAEATIGVNHVVLAGLISDLEKLKG